jgi:hypothetical protein
MVKGFVEDKRSLGVLLDRLDGLVVVAEESWCSSFDSDLVRKMCC